MVTNQDFFGCGMFLYDRLSFCKENNLSMNASWLIKPNDASNIMAAKIHEMKKGKGRILPDSCSHNTFFSFGLTPEKSARTFVGTSITIFEYYSRITLFRTIFYNGERDNFTAVAV